MCIEGAMCTTKDGGQHVSRIAPNCCTPHYLLLFSLAVFSVVKVHLSVKRFSFYQTLLPIVCLKVSNKVALCTFMHHISKQERINLKVFILLLILLHFLWMTRRILLLTSPLSARSHMKGLEVNSCATKGEDEKKTDIMKLRPGGTPALKS